MKIYEINTKAYKVRNIFKRLNLLEFFLNFSEVNFRIIPFEKHQLYRYN